MSKNKRRNKNKQKNNQKKEIGKQEINKENLIEIKLASIKELFAVFILSFIIFFLLRSIPDIGIFKIKILVNDIMSEHKAPVTISSIAFLCVIPALLVNCYSQKKCINKINNIFIRIFNFTSSLILVYLGASLAEIMESGNYEELLFSTEKFQPIHLIFLFLISIRFMYSKCISCKILSISAYTLFIISIIYNLYSKLTGK